ncbi:UDP-N-acetylglucosamine--N-acetylmuramyl-(pentapeptide) pyrophosphoryl-undecaprenol N-acetylglucosamine transferase [Bienertia sinuspersici]
MDSQEKDNLTIDPTNPLYLHPNEGPLNVMEKLQGVTNYRTWRRSVELALAGRRKLGFITGQVTSDRRDKRKQELWDTCNNVVIGWLHATMSEKIKKSVLYYTSARNKHVVASGEEILNDKWCNKIQAQQDDMNLEITAFIQALEQPKEEQHLFHFINGLDKDYAKERSQLLMQSPLLIEAVAMSSKKMNARNAKTYKQAVEEECKECGKRNHSTEKCWNIIGYPKGHPMAKLKSKRKGGSGDQRSNKRISGDKVAAYVTSQGESSGSNAVLTPQQVETVA